MYVIKLIFFTIAELFRQLRSFPKAMVAALRQRKMKAEGMAGEAERLDRIRNPSKYQGR